MRDGKLGLRDMFLVLCKKQFCLGLIPFVFLNIPLALIILFVSVKIDRYLGFKHFIGYPYNVIFFLIFSSAGFVIICQAYAYLIIVGQGMACPYAGFKGTGKLVTTGPYAVVRHPSVIGKLLGVLSIGMLSGSFFFTFIVIPVLLTWSVYYNRFIQEELCVKKFGNEYVEYRKRVPMLIPKIK
ncbi:MAG: isoprenylcysteine carboxylmethyltransferase family protein [Candidatus Omnitrophota bacterium]